MPYRLLFPAIFLLWGCSSLPVLHPGKGSGLTFSRTVLPEASGIVPSRITPGIFWLINDSGNAPTLVALDRQGTTVAVLSVPGVKNIDWESLTPGPGGKLVIGDLGNNRRRRVDQKLIVIDEPDPQQPEIQAAKSFPLVFTDLAPFDNRTPNVEALFTVDDQYWILTKRRDDRSLLCRIQMNFTDPAAKVEPVQSLAIPGQVTGADYNAHRREVAVLTYTAVYLFQWRPESVPLGNYPRKTIPIFFKQAEGICWDGNAVRIENEQGEMKVISID